MLQSKSVPWWCYLSSYHEDTALELYDMHLDEAAKKILEIRQNDANNASEGMPRKLGNPQG